MKWTHFFVFFKKTIKNQKEVKKGMSQPISRVLSRIIIHLDSTSPQNSSNLPWPSQDWHKGLYLVLLQTGFTMPYTVTLYAVRSYRTFSPLPTRGGLFSVALSVTSQHPDVIWHHSLWSPDFPLSIWQRLPGQLDDHYKYLDLFVILWFAENWVNLFWGFWRNLWHNFGCCLGSV